MAPTAAIRQPFRLIVISTAGREAELRSVYHRSWFSYAPLLICACALPDEAWYRRTDGKNYSYIDVAIVMNHLTLAATELGLGTCWVAVFDVAACDILGLLDEVEPVTFTPLGYPADQPEPKSRKPLSKLVRYERWQ